MIERDYVVVQEGVESSTTIAGEWRPLHSWQTCAVQSIMD